jgi:hypothetical protein
MGNPSLVFGRCFLKSTYRPRERFRALPVVSDMLVFGRLA